MHKTVPVIVSKGKTISASFLERMFKEHKSCGGLAFSDQGAIRMMHIDEGLDLEQFTEVLESLKEYTVLCAFHKFSAGWTKQSLQPFTLVSNSDNQPLVIGVLDGDYTNYPHGDSNHSNQYIAARDYLIPKLTKEMNSNGNDLDKLFDSFKEKLFESELMNLIFPQGSIVLLGANGRIETFQKHCNLARTFEWGWTSDCLGHLEEFPDKQEIVEEVVPEKKLSMLDRMKAQMSSPSAKKIEQETAIKITKETDTRIPMDADASIMMRPPSTLRKDGAVKGWYRDACGIVPSGWSDDPRPEVPVTKQTALFLDKKYKTSLLKSFGELASSVLGTSSTPTQDEAVEEDKSTAAATTVPSSEVEPGSGKTSMLDRMRAARGIKPIASTEPIKQPEKTEEGSAEHIPVIPADQKESLKNIIDSLNPKMILDPAKLQAFEKRYPTFYAALGMNGIEDTREWPPEVMIRMMRVAPEAMLVYLMNLRTLCFKQQDALKQQEEATQRKAM